MERSDRGRAQRCAGMKRSKREALSARFSPEADDGGRVEVTKVLTLVADDTPLRCESRPRPTAVTAKAESRLQGRASVRATVRYGYSVDASATGDSQVPCFPLS
jgi:hypothetical protein